MMLAVFFAVVAAATAVRLQPSFGEKKDALVEQISTQADNMLERFVSQARMAIGTDAEAGEEPPPPTPGPARAQDFDEAWFSEKCDLDEFTSESFNQPQYLYDDTESIDNARWTTFRKCEDPGLGTAVTDWDSSSKHHCAGLCQAQAATDKGKVLCCMYHDENSLCQSYWGWQGLFTSNWGRYAFWKTPKEARLIFAPSNSSGAGFSGEKDELNQTDVGQDAVKNLTTQVNALSIDGILDHLLSFYICMRWVPDADFIKLATFELEHVSVDGVTPALGSAPDRNAILSMALNADLTPLRCNSAINVQHIPLVDKLLASFNNTESEMYQLYTFVKEAYAQTEGLFVNRRSRLNGALFYNGTDGVDSVYVQDARAMARKTDNLPWQTYLRSSNDFDHHFSSSDNLFMICFGPRVASYPHKRENGGHVLADGNMAGCNAFWDFATMKDNLERIKKLFAPEMCFEHTLRKELKDKFIATFVEMNEEFELAMQNQFSKRVHELDPTKHSALGSLSARQTTWDGAGPLSSGETTGAYKKMAHILANAHAKWVVCPTRKNGSNDAFGNSDNFFRNPAAYKKWIGELIDETEPQCKTLDPVTGCVKCAIAVLDEYRCHVRLNVTLNDVLTALREKTYPFLTSTYVVREEVINEVTGAPELQNVPKEGACMVRKSVGTTAAAGMSGNISDIRDAFFNVNSTDSIVNVLERGPLAADSDDHPMVSDMRFMVSKRIRAQEQFLLDGGIIEDTATDQLIDFAMEEQYTDLASDWAKKFVFTHEEAEFQNRPKHKVDYFVSCPCTSNDFKPTEHFQNFGSLSMGDYYNFR